MNTAEQLIGILNQGMALVQAAGSARLGSSATARKLAKLHEVYFGATKFTARQREARTTTHDFDTLMLIEGKMRGLDKDKAWQLRTKLCATPARRIHQVAREFRDEHLPKVEPKPGVFLRRNGEMWTLCIIANQRIIADIWAHQDGTVETFQKTFHDGAAKPVKSTRVIMTAPQRAKILDGDGDDIILQLTDGTTMTGAEWIAEELHKQEFVAGIFSPLTGPVRAYQNSRFANEHMRELCSMENPICAWPGCKCPADEAEFHHMEPFIDGGPTNIENLVTLCRYHNRRNSDRGPNTNGRMKRIGAATCWVSPYGRVVKTGMYALAA